jgi:hypothetical protein
LPLLSPWSSPSRQPTCTTTTAQDSSARAPSGMI